MNAGGQRPIFAIPEGLFTNGTFRQLVDKTGLGFGMRNGLLFRFDNGPFGFRFFNGIFLGLFHRTWNFTTLAIAFHAHPFLQIMNLVRHFLQNVPANDLRQNHAFRGVFFSLAFAKRPEMRIQVVANEPLSRLVVVVDSRSLIMQSTIDPRIVAIDANNDTTIVASEVQIEE